MKFRQNTALLNRGCRWILAAFLAGMIMSFPFDSPAETNDGKINAKEGSVDVKRDPFWPIGYEPVQVQQVAREGSSPQASAVTGQVDWDEAMKNVVINGVSSRSDNEYIAVINNEVKSVGEVVTLQFKGNSYTWKVESITPPGSVKLRRHEVK